MIDVPIALPSYTASEAKQQVSNVDLVTSAARSRVELGRHILARRLSG